jgi:capsid protein
LVKLHELDQYDDAELVRKKLAAMFAAFITENNPEDRIGSKPGEGETDPSGAPLAGIEPGSMVKLLPGEDVKFYRAGRRGRHVQSSCACSCARSPPAWGSPTSNSPGISSA